LKAGQRLWKRKERGYRRDDRDRLQGKKEEEQKVVEQNEK
jgi:hypothetical protein